MLLPQADEMMRRFSFIPYARLDDLMVSYATDGGGVGPHFDSYDVFLLQGMGKRRWRIGNQKDQTLIDGLPIRILKDFRPVHDWVLEPGDLLYLPPEWAHDGVAVGECMTYSVGFRAAPAQELAEQFLIFLQDRVEPARPLPRPGPEAAEAPGEDRRADDRPGRRHARPASAGTATPCATSSAATSPNRSRMSSSIRPPSRSARRALPPPWRKRGITPRRAHPVAVRRRPLLHQRRVSRGGTARSARCSANWPTSARCRRNSAIRPPQPWHSLRLVSLRLRASVVTGTTDPFDSEAGYRAAIDADAGRRAARDPHLRPRPAAAWGSTTGRTSRCSTRFLDRRPRPAAAHRRP